MLASATVLKTARFPQESRGFESHRLRHSPTSHSNSILGSCTCVSFLLGAQRSIIHVFFFSIPCQNLHDVDRLSGFTSRTLLTIRSYIVWVLYV